MRTMSGLGFSIENVMPSFRTVLEYVLIIALMAAAIWIGQYDWAEIQQP